MLRLSQQSDLSAVFSIYMHEAVIPYMAYDSISMQSFTPVFDELVESKSFFILEIDSRIKGFCRVNRHKGRASHTASLFTLAIDPTEQGTGIAQLMMKLIFEYLQSQNIMRVDLMVEEDNQRAYTFYKKLGFELEGAMRSAFKRSHEAHYITELFLAKFLTETHNP